MQFNAGYGMSIIAANFSENGNKTNLAELGTASLEHQYNFEIGYGIFDFVELTTAISYRKRGERKTNETILSLYDPQLEISYLDNYKGFGDLYVGAGFSYAFLDNKIEAAFYPGISLSVFSNEPDEPNHEYIPLTEDSISKISFVNNYKYSSGANQLHLGAGIKFRADKIGISANYRGAYPLNVSETVKWDYSVVGSNFNYEDISYDYLISNYSFFMIKAEYQAIPWFNLSLDFSSGKYSEGWSEEIGIRLANPETSVSKLTVGCEVKVTGKLWLTQHISYPVAGKNQIAPVVFLTNVSYNFFPF
jgi:hypothetical protein